MHEKFNKTDFFALEKEKQNDFLFNLNRRRRTKQEVFDSIHIKIHKKEKEKKQRIDRQWNDELKIEIFH
mgnify:FL=1